MKHSAALKIAAACLAGALLAGCPGYPAGDPPDGSIVTNPVPNKPSRPLSSAEAADFFVNALSFAVLEYCPGTTVYGDFDPATAAAAGYVLRKTGELTDITSAPRPGKWILRSRLIKNVWHMALLRGGTEVWSDEAPLRD